MRDRNLDDWIQSGWRAGRNPPFVLGSIHLIGLPASHAELIDAYYPFHRVAWHISPSIGLLNVSASKPNTDQGSFLRQSSDSNPSLTGHASAKWVEFPQAYARKLPTGSPAKRNHIWVTNKCCASRTLRISSKSANPFCRWIARRYLEQQCFH